MDVNIPAHSRMHHAARSPQEREFLAACLADPSDLDRQLIYADWLDDRSDDRADLIRRLIAARDEGSLAEQYDAIIARLAQDEDPFASNGWLRLLGWELRHRLANLRGASPEIWSNEFEQSLMKLAKPGLIFTPREDPLGAGEEEQSTYVCIRYQPDPTRTDVELIWDDHNDSFDPEDEDVPDNRRGDFKYLQVDLGLFEKAFINPIFPREGVLSWHGFGYDHYWFIYGPRDEITQGTTRNTRFALDFSESLYLPEYRDPCVADLIARWAPNIRAPYEGWPVDPIAQYHSLFPGYATYLTEQGNSQELIPLLNIHNDDFLGWEVGIYDATIAVTPESIARREFGPAYS